MTNTNTNSSAVKANASGLPVQPSPIAAGTPRALWAVVGMLAVATLGLGAAVVQMRWHSDASVATQAVPGVLAPTVGAAATDGIGTFTEKKVLVAPVKPAQAAIKNGAKKTTESHTPAAAVAAPKHVPVVAAAAEPVGSQPVSAPMHKVVCVLCGTVEAVAPIEREAAGTGVGAIAGAVLGGLVGNQFGGGDGKSVATMAGALGGGWAGNAVEKRMKKHIVYQVDVRMDDGSTQRVEQSSPVAVGAHVTVSDGVISPQIH